MDFQPVSVGSYFAKPMGKMLSVEEGREAFLVPQLIERPYARNLPEQEKFAYLVGQAVGVNVAEVLLARERLEPLPPGCAYWSRDTRTYRVDLLPHQDPWLAEAYLFVLAVLLRDWDDCESNRSTLAGVPITYDFGDTGNPNLADVDRYARVLKTLHPGGHYACTTLYVRAFSGEQRPRLDQAVRAFASLTPDAIEKLGAACGATEVCPEVVAQTMACRASLRRDVERLFLLVG